MTIVGIKIAGSERKPNAIYSFKVWESKDLQIPGWKKDDLLENEKADIRK